MSRNNRKGPPPPMKPPAFRRNPEDLRTIGARKRMIRKMQIAGLIFILAGVFMPNYSPYFAQKGWKLLIGITLPWYKVCIIAGCCMLIISIACFLRSYRCPKCGRLLAMTPYTRITKCRECGVKLDEKAHYFAKGEDTDA